jgi:uncharacterized protein (DUF1330 family)
MAAYAIFIRNSISDPEAMKIYGGLAAKAGSPKMKALAVYGPTETLEGQPSEGVVLIEFPTMEDAKAWYNSPAYQEALPHRLRGSDYRVLLFQGL